MTKPNDDTVYLRRDVMEAFKRSDEKMESYSRKADEKMENFSRKADEMMEKFLQITSTAGNQIQGMNSSIVKMKEEGDDRYKHFNTRITNIEEKSWTWMKNMKTEMKLSKENMLIRIKEKQW